VRESTCDELFLRNAGSLDSLTSFYEEAVLWAECSEPEAADRSERRGWSARGTRLGL